MHAMLLHKPSNVTEYYINIVLFLREKSWSWTEIIFLNQRTS